jgi:hypothetical protein
MSSGGVRVHLMMVVQQRDHVLPRVSRHEDAVQQDYGGIVGPHAANFDTGLFSAEQFPQPQIVGLPMRVFFGKSLPPGAQAA